MNYLKRKLGLTGKYSHDEQVLYFWDLNETRWRGEKKSRDTQHTKELSLVFILWEYITKIESTNFLPIVLCTEFSTQQMHVFHKQRQE